MQSTVNTSTHITYKYTVLTPYFLKTHFKIIVSSTLMFSAGQIST